MFIKFFYIQINLGQSFFSFCENFLVKTILINVKKFII